MKLFRNLALILFVVVLAAACEKKETTDLIVDEISVPGATCEMCQATISASVKKIDGVKIVDVDLTKKVATIGHLPSVSKVDLQNAIAASGYNADHVVKDSTAYENLPECCK